MLKDNSELSDLQEIMDLNSDISSRSSQCSMIMKHKKQKEHKLESFQLIRLVGQGAFGKVTICFKIINVQVYLGENKITKEQVAVKVIRKDKLLDT